MTTEERIINYINQLRNDGFEAICFLLPAYNVGGGTFYFCELAKCIVSKCSIEVYYCDYKNGYPSSLLENSGVKIVEYLDKEIEFPIREKCIVITNSTRAILLKKMRPDNKIFFWHYETFHCGWDSVFLRGETNSFFELCFTHKAMSFHDWSGWRSLSDDFGKEFNKIYLPLSLPMKGKRALGNPKKEDEINLTWLGRLGHDKVRSLEYLIENFAKYQTNRRKILHIVGDGFERAFIEKRCQSFSQSIEFDMPGTVPHDQIGDYLIENTDILFAMGLSAYEGITLGIPTATVLIDTRRIEKDAFLWLHDSHDFSAGILTEQMESFGEGFRKFSDIMEKYLDSLSRREIHEKMDKFCSMYCLSNEQKVEMLLSSLLDCSLSMGDVAGCLKYIPYRNIVIKKTRLFGRKLPDKMLSWS